MNIIKVAVRILILLLGINFLFRAIHYSILFSYLLQEEGRRALVAGLVTLGCVMLAYAAWRVQKVKVLRMSLVDGRTKSDENLLFFQVAFTFASIAAIGWFSFAVYMMEAMMSFGVYHPPTAKEILSVVIPFGLLIAALVSAWGISPRAWAVLWVPFACFALFCIYRWGTSYRAIYYSGYLLGYVGLWAAVLFLRDMRDARRRKLDSATLLQTP